MQALQAAETKQMTVFDKALNTAATYIQRMLGSKEIADRLLVVVLNMSRKTPALRQCSAESMIDCLVRMARLGLDPSIPNEIFLIPYKNEASLIVGYGGLRKLVLRNPDVVDVFAQVVCQNDYYRPAETQVALPTHRLPEGFQPRGRAIGYYAAALLKSGIWRVVCMSKAEVIAHRDRYSQGAKSTFWSDNHADKEGLSNLDKMAMKTVLRQLCSPRYLSLDRDVAAAMETEEALYRPLPAETAPRAVPIPSMSQPLDVLSEELSGDYGGLRETQQRARQTGRQARTDDDTTQESSTSGLQNSEPPRGQKQASPSPMQGMAWDTLRAHMDDARLPADILERIGAALSPLAPATETEAIALAEAVLDWLSVASEADNT